MTTNPVVELVAGIDYPMFILTANDGVERSGCLIGFVTQCSITPPRFIVCISIRNHTFRVLDDVEIVVVHLVPSDAEDLGRALRLRDRRRGRQVRADGVARRARRGARPRAL